MTKHMTETGSKLKEIRKAKGLTLKEVADLSGLSTAYLSNVERNATSPTTNNLFKISIALGVDIVATLEQSTHEESCVVRKADRTSMFYSSSKVTYEVITGDDHNIAGICITVDADCYDEFVSGGHSDRDELGLVTEGSVALFLNGEEHDLEVGDTIFVARNTPHSYKKLGPDRNVTYWFYAKEASAK